MCGPHPPRPFAVPTGIGKGSSAPGLLGPVKLGSGCLFSLCCGGPGRPCQCPDVSGSAIALPRCKPSNLQLDSLHRFRSVTSPWGSAPSRLSPPNGTDYPTGPHLQPSRVLTGLPWPSTGSGTWEGLCPVTPVSSVTSPVTPFLVARPPPTALPIFPSGRPHPCPACVVCPGQPAPRPVAYLPLRPKYTPKQFVCQAFFAPISALLP